MNIFFPVIIFSGLLSFSASNLSQSNIATNQSTSAMHVNENTTDTEDFVLTREKLNDSLKYGWFTKDYAAYSPGAINLNKLRDVRKHLSFVVYAGSWCDDTHMWLPKFYKTVERAGVKKKNIQLFGVDRDKKTVGNEKDKTGPEKILQVERVPTFIVYYKDKEIGRIVESVRENMETDMVRIIEDAKLQKRIK